MRAILTGGSGNLGPIWKAELEKLGYDVFVIDLPHCNVADNLDVKRVATFYLNKFGAPNVIINNAAIDNPPGSEASFFSNYERVIDVNLKGAINVVKHFIDAMIDNDGGNIVNIGSMLGFIASNPNLYPEGFDKPCGYGAAKAGLWNFTNNCNTRFASKGVISNYLALSAVEGNQAEEFKQKYIERIPIKRMLRKEDFIREFACCVQATVPYDAPMFVGGGWTIW